MNTLIIRIFDRNGKANASLKGEVEEKDSGYKYYFEGLDELNSVVSSICENAAIGPKPFLSKELSRGSDSQEIA